jgi:hypothetical protein
LEDDREALRSRGDGGGLWLHGKHSGERGPGKPEGLGANREVSRVANGEAELTEATNATGTERWSRSSVSGGGTWLVVCVERERGRESSAEGANEQGEWASGARGLKGRGRAEVAGEHVVVGASMAGERG